MTFKNEGHKFFTSKAKLLHSNSTQHLEKSLKRLICLFLIKKPYQNTLEQSWQTHALNDYAQNYA